MSTTTIRFADTTLCRENGRFSFKEKLEIARQLERLNTDVIELPEIANVRADTLFVRTAASFVKSAVLSVAAGSDRASVENAILALSDAVFPRVRVEVPVSTVGMEYTAHRKPPKMLEWIAEAVALAAEKIPDVEFCAVDATRAEPEFLDQAIRAAVDAGAKLVTVCDSAAEILPDEFAKFAERIVKKAGVPVGVRCENRTGLACAGALMAVRAGATTVKVCVDGSVAPLETFAGIVRACGERYGLSTRLRLTELQRTVGQIRRISENALDTAAVIPAPNDQLILNENDPIAAVTAAVTRLGYDLSEEDQKKVYEEFRRTAAKKQVGARELDAIVANTAMQVPSAYQLVNYVVNSGNIISASAQITLIRDGKSLSGVSIGDGPIAAAFSAIEQIVGHRYELDDFQIQSVTEGREALGSALVRLRADGRVYSGNGISTDIIGAAIRAYLSAVNKIIYEEEQA